MHKFRIHSSKGCLLLIRSDQLFERTILLSKLALEGHEFDVKQYICKYIVQSQTVDVIALRGH